MAASVIAKYVSQDLLEDQSSPLAISDKNQKILWYNKSFKNILGARRLKGITISSLFNFTNQQSTELLNGKKQNFINVPSEGYNLKINPLPARGKSKTLRGYLLEIIPSTSEVKVNSAKDTPPLESTFQQELQIILMLLARESSIEELSEEILKKSLVTTSSDFSLIIFIEDGDVSHFDYYDPKNKIDNRAEKEKVIASDFKFVSKWLLLNKQTLVALNENQNIANNLVQSFSCNSLLISPCIFEGNLLAAIITGKTEGSYSNAEIEQIGLFATLLGFAITNTKTRELNTALESRLLQAQKLETIGKLSSGMAHDFSNLLSSIFGSVNLLRKRVELSRGVDKLIDNIENCSARAKDLTKGLLSFGKPTPKRKELVKPPQLLKEISKVVTQTFPKNITFVEETDDDLKDILGNATEIYQMLLNLCVNAKEATNEKGTITLSAKNISIDRTNTVNYPLLKEGNYVCFSVSDNGEGIDEKNLSRIFDPYFSTRSKETGSGLGLYVTYGIVKAHKGYIDVSSTPGKGTTFDVYIPTFEPPKEKKAEPSEKIILLADDEPMLSDLLAELLESNGYNVIKVSSGDEVLKVLTEEIKVDLAIVDYNMPGLNGLETIAEIRKREFNIPIILSSGSLKLEEEGELDHYNINSKVEKPYEFDTMLSTIQKIL
jgi:signal transduction histidine kinase/CheY-like chemotaxis protein